MTHKTKGGEIRNLVMTGQTEWLEKFRGQVPWDEFSGSTSLTKLLTNAAYYNSTPAHAKLAQDAVVRLIEFAIEDGVKEIFGLEGVNENGRDFVNPIQMFLERDFNRALVLFIQNGFDPIQARGDNARTALDVAMELGKEPAVDIIRSYQARQVANETLREMNVPFNQRMNP